jgi:23S rRNA pseudouridine1911/1915/1917 synthase
MNSLTLKINDFFTPQILLCEAEFILVYKAPKMHSAAGKGNSLVEWYGEKYPEQLSTIDKGEAGLIHRLDYETHGLVLFARNQNAYYFFIEQQKRGEIVKEYDALVSSAQEQKEGFPVFDKDIENFSTNASQEIKSLFRPYGPGRKEVRPVVENTLRSSAAKKKAGSKIYATEIIEIKSTAIDDIKFIRVTIQQGYRHQIRCHLAWARFPVLNDTVYGGRFYSASSKGTEKVAQGILALRAKSISFVDPGSGEKLRYTLPDFALNEVSG